MSYVSLLLLIYILIFTFYSTYVHAYLIFIYVIKKTSNHTSCVWHTNLSKRKIIGVTFICNTMKIVVGGSIRLKARLLSKPARPTKIQHDNQDNILSNDVVPQSYTGIIHPTSERREKEPLTTKTQKLGAKTPKSSARKPPGQPNNIIRPAKTVPCSYNWSIFPP